MRGIGGCFKSAFLLAILPVTRPAFAGPPWNVDDPGTTDYRHTILYLAYISKRAGRSSVEALPSLAITYGLSDGTELGVGSGALAASDPDSRIAYGVGDSAVSLKHRVIDRGSTALAFAYQVSLPTGNRNSGLGSGSVDHGMWLTGSYTSGRATFIGDLGDNVYGSRAYENSCFWGGVATLDIGEGTTVGAQLYGNSPQTPGGSSDASWGIGLTRELGNRTQLQFQAGRSLKGQSDLTLFVGLTFEFGGDK